MLPEPKDKAALQEYVGDNPGPTEARRAKRARFSMDVEVPTPLGEDGAREPMKVASPGEAAPIKMIDGRAWSPGIYRALRLMGRSLEVAWEKAFVR